MAIQPWWLGGRVVASHSVESARTLLFGRDSSYQLPLRESLRDVLTTQISTCPRATQQGRVKCRLYGTVPAVTTQEAIPDEGRS